MRSTHAASARSKDQHRRTGLIGAAAALVAALGSVDAVCVFEDTNARLFLEVAEPDVWAKGADYTLETLNQEERRIVESKGGVIRFIPLVPGRSTTNTLKRLGAA